MAESMRGMKRTCRCAELSEKNIGEEVTMMGWVQKQRNKGGIIFVDMRDRSGILQVIFEDGEINKADFAKAEKLRSEFVIAVKGKVTARSGAVNENLATGAIELRAEELRVLSESDTPPFPIEADSKTKEELRLKYRYLDLRRPDLQKNLIMRSKVATLIRQFLADEGFLEIETPMLTKSTPEGARDYLVPSRVHPGTFYALPQSPQLFKQLLMCSGYDRYFQLARCFRDEDLRADRQPEFTQVDMELSFVDEDDVMDVNERLLQKLFKEILDVDIELPIQRMTWQEAMDRFGSDKPDLRFGMELKDVSEVVKGSFAKFMTDDELKALVDAMEGEPGDLLLFAADKNKIVWDVLGNLRLEIAKNLDLLDKNVYKFLWVTEFPEFEYSEEQGRYLAMHHPVTMPFEDDIQYLESNPEKVRARAYDIVLNGTEIGGGSIRIHQDDVQEKMLRALGFTDEKAHEQFGFLLDAFKYGVPPHAGLAYGLDRLVMIMAHEDSIRDVIAFPKIKDASCLMTDAPNVVDDKQLEELSLEIAKSEQEQ